MDYLKNIVRYICPIVGIPRLVCIDSLYHQGLWTQNVVFLLQCIYFSMIKFIKLVCVSSWMQKYAYCLCTPPTEIGLLQHTSDSSVRPACLSRWAAFEENGRFCRSTGQCRYCNHILWCSLGRQLKFPEARTPT